jgi:uncharacterized coiled-coil DUF342 family protein
MPNQPGRANDTLAKTRLFSQEYADIAKLREESQKMAHRAMKMRLRSQKYLTSMEKYRHKATVLREKAAIVRDKIPGVEDNMKELENELRVGAQGVSSGGVRPREQSSLHVKIRKCQEKIVALQRRSAAYEARATHAMSVSSQKKVTSDIFMEKAKVFQDEADNLGARADRLTKATEGDMTAVRQR